MIRLLTNNAEPSFCLLGIAFNFHRAVPLFWFAKPIVLPRILGIMLNRGSYGHVQILGGGGGRTTRIIAGEVFTLGTTPNAFCGMGMPAGNKTELPVQLGAS